jgi:hypothetical protein
MPTPVSCTWKRSQASGGGGGAADDDADASRPFGGVCVTSTVNVIRPPSGVNFELLLSKLLSSCSSRVASPMMTSGTSGAMMRVNVIVASLSRSRCWKDTIAHAGSSTLRGAAAEGCASCAPQEANNRCGKQRRAEVVRVRASPSL